LGIKMTRGFIALATAAIYFTPPPAFCVEQCLSPPLSNERVAEIVAADRQANGAPLDFSKLKYKVTREGCSYIFYGWKPNRLGAHFWIKLDEAGKIIARIPGA
jgi:hypothetical protein